MTAAIIAVAVVLGVLSGWVTFLFLRDGLLRDCAARCREQLLTEMGQPLPPPQVARRRWWAVLNRKEPEPPGWVTTGFTEADRTLRP